MVALLFITFAVCLAIGVPVAFSLGISSLVYFVGNGMSLYMFAQRFFAGLNSFTLLCIPGFVFAGSLMNQGGITERLIGSNVTGTTTDCAKVSKAGRKH